MKGELAELVQQPEFSFFMRDSGMQEILKKFERETSQRKYFSAMIKKKWRDSDGDAG
ncbi:hypothetical protein LFLEISCH_08654 [Listeria fleischmannii subsp. fleischmannii LU2006-1]|nr:hypothetical protein LFLEISCH_08654 [Listeria fleischmannii subsp. fleischmannii LU2006-1]